ncbi:MAG TPA: hypothetical protein VMG59_06710 [Phycisphaerae bacterium]|nr:hypothetical protein [Phycisphaerae bacterium]
MAIVVQCFQCSSVLELDDGFRGGVARCSNCGTLLKVPKDVGAAGAPGGPRNPAMPQPRPRSASDPGISSGGFRSGSAHSRTGDTPVSSGAFSRSPRPRAPAIPQPGVSSGRGGAQMGAAGGDQNGSSLKSKQPLLLLFVFIVGAIFCVAVLVIVHELSPKSTQIIAPRLPVTPNNNVVSNVPKFLGIPMVGTHVLFAIDGSAANSDTFTLVAENIEYAVKHGISSQHYRALIWNNDNGVSVPNRGWARRSSNSTVWKPLTDYVPAGESDPLQMILRCTKINPVDQVIVITAREDLTDQLIKQVDDLQIHVRIDAISVNTPSTVLAQIADEHNGVYQQVSTIDLQNALGN